MKKAYLVKISLMTRVIATSEEEAEELAEEKFPYILRENYPECIEEIEEDEEVPYNEKDDE